MFLANHLQQICWRVSARTPTFRTSVLRGLSEQLTEFASAPPFSLPGGTVPTGSRRTVQSREIADEVADACRCLLRFLVRIGVLGEGFENQGEKLRRRKLVF
jgi:hypothetical protein